MTTKPDNRPWSHEIVLRGADLDYLGHVTEVAHVAMFEEARYHLMAAALGTEWPVYVVSAHDLRFRREIRLVDSPVKVELELVAMGERNVGLTERLLGADGSVRTESEATLVAFDLSSRRSRVWTIEEADHIRQLLAG